MPVDYVDRIRQMEWPGLRALWAHIGAGTAAAWPPGKALEHLVLRAFELSGATVRWPYTVWIGDETVEQIDGAVHARGLSRIVECKDTAEPTKTEAIAKLRNQLLRRPAGAIGLMFSRTGFTPTAVAQSNFMAPQAILLWDGEEIAYLLQQEDFASALVTKHRRSIEEGRTLRHSPGGRSVKTYVVAETAFHGRLIKRLLHVGNLPEFVVVRGGRQTSAVGLASSLRSERGVPVVVVLDADTVEPHAIVEKRDVPEYLLNTGAYPRGTRPAAVLVMAVPQVEAVLFSDPDALECVLGRPLTEREKIEGEFRPRAVLDRLLADTRMDEDALLEKINPKAAAGFAAHPLIREVAQAIENANAALADAA